MSDQNGSGDSGSKDRATVALVDSKVDTVLAVVKGHAQTTAAKLDALTEKVDAQAGVPDRVTRLEEKVGVMWADRSWKRIHWPTFLLAAVAVGAAIAALFI